MRITNLSNIRREFQNTAWVIHEPKLEAIADVLSVRMSDTPLTAEAIQARIGDAPARQGRSTQGAVAVVPLSGTLYPKANLVTESSGGASVEQFIANMEAAAADPAVSAIVIDTDSPGGAAQGIPEAAARLRALRGSKPIVAVASGMMASGAYWLASQADSIVASPSAEIGSVGAFMVHQDFSQQFANDGVQNTVVRAGKFKAETNPFEPLTEDARSALQSRVDEAYSMFVSDLAKGRGVSVATVKEAFGQGRVIGPKSALQAGMIDKLGTLQSVVRDLQGPRASAYRRAADGALPVFADADVFAMDTVEFPLPDRAGATVENTNTSTFDPPLAEELTVDISTNAPTGAGTQAPSREMQLAELATLTGNSAKLGEWIMSTKSVADVRGELLSAQSQPTTTTSSASVQVGVMRETQRPWESFGHFSKAVYDAGRPGVRDVDPRLYAAATGINQSSPSEGGFAVPGTYAQSIWDGVFTDPTSLLSQTDNYDIEGAFWEVPRIEETTRATGTVYGGVTAYWRNEADQITNSKPKFGTMRLEPQELNALVYITEKHINNSPIAMGQYVDRMGRAAIALKTNSALVGGDGVGKPKGLTNSGSKITVTKETSQAAATINARNLGKMKARRLASVANQYVWLANTDVQPELDDMSTIVKNVAGTENVGGYSSPLYNPGSNMLAGLPIVFNDHCEALGTEGDLILVHLKSYAVGLRRGGLQTAQSMHLRFDYKEVAFRFDFEIDGQSWLNSAITPAKGSTKSNIITLQTR